MRTVSSSIRSSPRAEKRSGSRGRQKSYVGPISRSGARMAPQLKLQPTYTLRTTYGGRSVARLRQLVVDHLDVRFQPRVLDRPVAVVLGRHLPAGRQIVHALPGLLRLADGGE